MGSEMMDSDKKCAKNHYNLKFIIIPRLDQAMVLDWYIKLIKR
jgi:hypothetical protein